MQKQRRQRLAAAGRQQLRQLHVQRHLLDEQTADALDSALGGSGGSSSLGVGTSGTPGAVTAGAAAWPGQRRPAQGELFWDAILGAPPSQGGASAAGTAPDNAAGIVATELERHARGLEASLDALHALEEQPWCVRTEGGGIVLLGPAEHELLMGA